MTDLNPIEENKDDLLDGNEETKDLGLSDQTVKLVLDAIWDDPEKAKTLFLELSITDQADLLEKIDSEPRMMLLELAEAEIQAVVYAELDADVRKSILSKMNPIRVARIISALDSDDALDLISRLDEDFQKQVLKKLSVTTRAAVEEGLTFPEKSAGRLMQREVVAIPQFWTVGKTLDYLRAASEMLPEDFHSLYIVDPTYHVLGEVLVSQVISAPRSVKISELTNENIFTVHSTTDEEEVAFLFQKEHLYSVPVLDDDERLIGVITADDVMDVIQAVAQEDILKLAGVTAGSDIYKAVLESAKSRFSWLSINLLTAIMASMVIGMFEATIQQVVALAVLMPIVASMGGNAGTQTLTIAVRALATKELSGANAWRFITKETMVGVLNGLLFALIIGVIAGVWFTSVTLGFVIAIAMIVNMIAAGLFGITIPLILDRLNIDPALASAVFLTTVTDVVGFFAFLGLAALLMF